ncbi:hypothetical protein VTN77DRAFT_3225 [Rasamsonia byssochlamydoides]|uniref:uncharacterized protein n=1 Tax=Rasamsonia byssochlamydoides TaxID=89139 RepID=UPI003743CFCF
MSWDRPVHSFSYPNGEPQTPTRTPTSTAFGDSAFQTPKIESSFYDPRVTWDTSDPYASSPEFLKTPQRFLFGTPSNSLHTDSPYGQQQSPHANAKATTEDTDTVKRRRPSKQNTSFGDDGPGTVNSAKCSAASMQTPPPTSTSRRRVADYNDGGDGQSNAGSARKLSTATDRSHLETPSRLIGASPGLFSNFQSSPDLFQLSSADPSASPFFPQHKLFWEQDADQQAGGIGLPNSSNDLFGSETPGPFTAASTASQSLGVPPLPALQGSMDLPEFSSDASFGIGSTAPADAALFPAPFSTSPRVPITKAEDPGLFLSSPARRFGPPQPKPEAARKPVPPRVTRQPYHHQTEESKREELLRARNKNRPLSGSFSDDDDDDDDYTPRARGTRLLGLTRSLTHTAVTSHSSYARQHSQQGMLASTSGVKKPPSRGRSSPVKTTRQPLSRANSTCLPSRSQSLVLKIDKDGRAKTEIQVVSGSSTGLTDPISEMDMEGSATESESESAEFPDYPIARSQSTSFALPGPPLTKPSVSRAGSVSRPNSKSSYASTIASSTSGRHSPWAESTRGVPKRPQSMILQHDWANTPQRFSVPANPDFTRGTTSSSTTDSTIPDPDEEDSGDAQHALRQLLKGRARNSRLVGGYGAGRVPVSQSLTHLRSSPPLNRFDIKSSDPTTSPTTLTDPDVATPSTDRRSNPSNGTRCICKSMDNGGHLMIQCESCNHWLHTKCVGLERSNLPPVYICVYCSQTPMRGGRLRDPLAGVGHAPSSPLARKSFRYR